MITTLPILFDDAMFAYAIGQVGHTVLWHSYSEMPGSVLAAIYDLTEGGMLGLPNLTAEWFDRSNS